MADGGPSSSSGPPTSCSHPLNSFGGILAGRADYHSNFNHRSFCSTWVPTDAHSVVQAAFTTLRCRRLYASCTCLGVRVQNGALLLPRGVRPTSSLRFDERSITLSFFFCSRQSWTRAQTPPNIYRRLVPGDPDPGRPSWSYPMDGYALIAKTYVLVRVTPLYHLLLTNTYILVVSYVMTARNGHMTFETGPLLTSRRAVVVDIRLSES